MVESDDHANNNNNSNDAGADGDVLEVAIDERGFPAGVIGIDNDDEPRIYSVTFGRRGCLLPEDASKVALTRQSFFMPVDGSVSPRCLIEEVVLEIFKTHTEGIEFDAGRSCAEWWCQVRQASSQSSGMLLRSGKKVVMPGGPNGMVLHWDKDEGLRDEYGVNLHPHIATVLYLCDSGAPTLVVPIQCAIQADDTEAKLADEEFETAFVSFPRRGKHLRFNGGFLHGVVPEIMANRSGCSESGERVTLLVNCWLNWIPHDLQRLPIEYATSLEACNAAEKLTLEMKEERWEKRGVRDEGDNVDVIRLMFGPNGRNSTLMMKCPTLDGDHSSYQLQFRRGTPGYFLEGASTPLHSSSVTALRRSAS